MKFWGELFIEFWKWTMQEGLSNIIKGLQGENRMIQNCRTWSIWEGDGGVSHVTFLHVTSSCSLSVTVYFALEIMWDLLFYKAAFVCLLEKLPPSTSVTVIFPSFSSLSILPFLPSCLSLTRSGIFSSHWSCSCLSLLKCIEITKPSASFGWNTLSTERVQFQLSKMRRAVMSSLYSEGVGRVHNS